MPNPARLCAALLALTLPLWAHAQLVVPLWAKGAPGFESMKEVPEKAADWWVRSVHNPSLTVFQPAAGRANGTAVIIAPGGGHENLVYTAEGVDAARFLNTLGVTAFVLKYRLAREAGSPYKLDVHPRQDAYRAIRLVRARSCEFGIDPARVGMMGFSAGGEVVASVAYGSGAPTADALDAVDKVNGKPDFQVLVYPGPLGIPSTLPADAPPAFMVAAMDDACCATPIIQLTQLYHQAGIAAEVHLYAKGAHGFNMGQRTTLKSVKDWPQRLADWLEDGGYLKGKR
ncbi:MAG: alpha/beta hydrolase [Gammaproteobacteria bacterium]